MGESVSFKAYLKQPGQEPEVRRFGIDVGAATSYDYLCSKIQNMFPSIRNNQFNIFWNDGDDFISVSTDEELLVALTTMSVQPIKLHIQMKPQQETSGGDPGLAHPGITCDGCEGPVAGFRYKCVSCPDYDLCARCEAKGLHPEHFMLRITTPNLSSHLHSKYFRKMFGKPHKFAKHHGGWHRMWEPSHPFTDTAPPPTPPFCGPCPFKKEDGPRGRPGPRVADMFDFSALMDFINSLGVVIDDKKSPEAASSSQAEPSAQQAQTSSQTQAQAPGPQRQEARSPRQTQSTEYLSNLGQAIAAFLDPFGVDVTFDVRPKETEKAASTATAAGPSSSPPTPGPSASPPAAGASSPVSRPSPVSGAATPVANPSSPSGAATSVANQMASAAAAAVNERLSSLARRNSDDWTLLNRESPTRGEEAMAVDVEESRGAKPKVYPELPKDVSGASAPPQPQADPQRQRVEEAAEKIRNMGFNFDPTTLRELLSNQNCDIVTVLEILLGNAERK